MNQNPILSGWRTIATVAVVTCAVQFACLAFRGDPGLQGEVRAAAQPESASRLVPSGFDQLIPICQHMEEILKRMDQRLERIEKAVVATSERSGQPNAASR